MRNSTAYIGICTHNCAKTLNKSLKSIHDQTYQYVRIIAYDDKSNDDTLKTLKVWKAKFENRGFLLDIIESQQEKSEGRIKSLERLNKIIASRICDNDIYIGLDGKEVLLDTNGIQNCVWQIAKTVCVAKAENAANNSTKEKKIIKGNIFKHRITMHRKYREKMDVFMLHNNNYTVT